MIELYSLVLTLGATLGYFYGKNSKHVFVVTVVIFLITILLFQKRRSVLLGVLLSLIFVLGVALIPTEEKYDYGDRTFEGRVTSVDKRIENATVTVTNQAFGKVQLRLNETNLLPGDQVRVSGVISNPEDFATQNGRLFPYKDFLRSRGITGIVEQPEASLIKTGGFSLNRTAAKLRFSIAELISKNVAHPVDGILSGMAAGYQGGITSSIQDLFRNTGVLHVLVLSGYNISLLIGVLLIILRSAPFHLRMIITFISILLLVLISGAGVASLRAGAMGAILLYASISLRAYSSLRALTICYLLFFFLSPTLVFVDPGFHFSFIATFFMIAVMPKINSWFWWIPKKFRDLFVLSFGMPIWMFPYIMYFSGIFPSATTPANILLSIVGPTLIIATIILIAVSWLHPAAQFLGILLSFLGTQILTLLTALEKLPILQTPPLSGWGVASIYFVIILALFRKEIKSYFLQPRTELQQQTN